MSVCDKCGKEMTEKANFCKACGSGVQASAGLDQKKSRVMNKENNWIKPVAIAAGVVLVVVAVWLLKDIVMAQPGGMGANFAPQRGAAGRQTNAVAVLAEGEEVRIPLASVEGGQARFFAYAAGGKSLGFFVMRAPDGSIRTAFDACMACNHAKLGYRQQGEHVVCNNCGMGFKAAEIGNRGGGCNPITLNSIVAGR